MMQLIAELGKIAIWTVLFPGILKIAFDNHGKSFSWLLFSLIWGFSFVLVCIFKYPKRQSGINGKN